MAIKRLSGRSVSRVANPSRRRHMRMRHNPANAALGRYQEIYKDLKKKHPNSKTETLRKKASAQYAKEKKAGGGSTKTTAVTKAPSTASSKSGGSRKRRPRNTKTVTFSMPGRKQRVGVTLYKNPGMVVAGVDMAPVAIGAVGAVAVNQLFERVDFLKKNVLEKVPKQAQPFAPSLVAILGGVLLHAGAERGMFGGASDFIARNSGYVAAAGLVIGLHKLTHQLLDKYAKKGGSTAGAYGNVGGAYGSVKMNGAYIMTDQSGMSGAYVQTPMSGVRGGAGAFGGITNFA